MGNTPTPRVRIKLGGNLPKKKLSLNLNCPFPFVATVSHDPFLDGLLFAVVQSGALKHRDETVLKKLLLGPNK